jgi:hypothetical protein
MSWESFGDDVLVAVTAAIVYGPTQPSLLSLPPLKNYNVQDVATAVAFVRFYVLCQKYHKQLTSF